MSSQAKGFKTARQLWQDTKQRRKFSGKKLKRKKQTAQEAQRELQEQLKNKKLEHKIPLIWRTRSRLRQRTNGVQLLRKMTERPVERTKQSANKAEIKQVHNLSAFKIPNGV